MTFIASISSAAHSPIFLTKRSCERATIWKTSAALSEESPFSALFSMPWMCGNEKAAGVVVSGTTMVIPP